MKFMLHFNLLVLPVFTKASLIGRQVGGDKS
jgi:hypothetical protein